MKSKEFMKSIEEICYNSTTVKVKRGQAVKVYDKDKNKTFTIVVTKPNGEKNKLIEGTANNKNFVCSFEHGKWVVKN